MVDIRIRDLPPEPNPNEVDVIPIDNGSTRKATIKSVVEAGRPVATQQDAEDGTNNELTMTSLRTKQAISFQVPALITQSIEDLNLGTAAQANVTDFATAAQGATADSAVQPSRVISAGAGLDGGGSLAANRTISLNAASIASLLLADSAAQDATEITAGSGLTGGGTLAANREIALNGASIASLVLANSAVQSVNGKSGTSVTLTASDVGAATTETVTTTANGLMIAADKVKLNGIAAGAQVNVPQVQTDWDATTGLGSILNKPTLGSLAAKNKVDISDLSATGTPSSATFLRGDNTWGVVAGAGTVTSVAMTVPTGLSVSGSPITGAGTIAVTYAAGYQGYTSTEASKLAGIQAGAQVNTVTSVAGKTGAVTLVKDDVGLGNVDNTADLAKPVSTATQTALNGKAGTAVATPTTNGLMSAADKVKSNDLAGLAFKDSVDITDIETAGVPSETTYLRGDGTWSTPEGGGGGGGGPQYPNVIINPLFNINQRAVSGTVTLAANQYGHDRWKAGSGGCTYTFSTSNGVTTISIAAGTLRQVVEAQMVAGVPGDYVLSWQGTAQGRINTGVYGASGNVSASISGSANVTIEFSTGTVSIPQFEMGSVTTFQGRPTQIELSMCHRYFRAIRPSGTEHGPSYIGPGMVATANVVALCDGVFFSPMRAIPSAQTSPLEDFIFFSAEGGGGVQLSDLGIMPRLDRFEAQAVFAEGSTVPLGAFGFFSFAPSSGGPTSSFVYLDAEL